MTVRVNRLLIAEDEPLLAVSMGDALRKQGWNVHVAPDERRDVSLFEQHLHEVVVTDLVMPSLDGIELLRRVKAVQADTTVVLITAHGTVDEAASGGTLFLDEIGDLPLAVQVKLLRVLQERQVERLGSNRPIDVDVRIVSASLRPLADEISEGCFREDLFFRINTVPIHLPPLRERREDIPLLAKSFLRDFSQERGKQIDDLTDEALEVLDAHDWPGNVRELNNVIERAVVFCRGSRIGAEHLPAELRSSAGPRPATSRETIPLRQAVERAEIEAIRAALAATGGQRTDAAELLGISRKTLWEKIKSYGISVS